MTKVTVVCYDEATIFPSKKKAINTYAMAYVASEGNERERYFNVLCDLNECKKIAWDHEGDMPENYV